MSASLVGSEMCIRDRSSKHVLTTAKAWPVPRCAALHERARTCGAPTAAVSYTHLTLPTICSV
eukprot:11414634-Alexandrium_andersonii.AAC.1